MKHLLHYHLQITSSDAPSYGMAKRLDIGVSGPKARAVGALYNAVLELEKLPTNVLVIDQRVHAILDAADVNHALGVLAAEIVHPESHFPGPIVCFRDKIIAIRQAADEIERQPR